MPLFGVRVEYSSDQKPFRFRFFTDASSLQAALDNGEQAWAIVKTIVGNDVTCDKVHAWIRNVSPNQFDNRIVDEVGDLPVSNPLKPEITTRIYFSAANSYPYYWDLRARLDAGLLLGTGFVSSYNTLLGSARLALQAMVTANKIVAKDGSELGNVTAPDEYFIHQLSKRHYNRTPSES